MRVVSVLLSFLALLATGVLSVSVVKLRRELRATRAELGTLRESCQEGSGFLGDDGLPPAVDRAERPAPAPRLAPAVLAPVPAPAPASGAALASPEAKAEVKRLVAEQLADEQRQRAAVREQREIQRHERMAAELGLGPSEQDRFVAVLTAMQAEWRQIRAQERAGEKTMAELRPQLAAVQQKADQELRSLLGEERMQKYQSMRGSQRGPGAPPPGPRAP